MDKKIKKLINEDERKVLMDEEKFAFQKKIGVHEMLYGEVKQLSDMFQRLLYCMKESNKSHEYENGIFSQHFRLDFRPQTDDEQILREFPIGSLVLDLKWGSRKEFEEKKKNKC